MNVLMISWEYPPKSVGGLAQHVHDLTVAMAKKGVKIHLLTCGTEGAPEEEKINGVHVIRVNPYRISSPDFTTWAAQFNVALLEKVMKLPELMDDIDLIHAHDWLVAYAARAIKHAFRLPLVSTIHATEWGRNHGLHNITQRHISDMEWWLTYESWKVICCSEYMFNELRNIFQLPADKLKIIPNGVDVRSFSVGRAGRNARHLNGYENGRRTKAGRKAGHETGREAARQNAGQAGPGGAYKVGQQSAHRPERENESGIRWWNERRTKTGRKAGHETGRETGHGAGRETGRKAGRETGHGAERETGQKAGHETGHGAGRETGRRTEGGHKTPRKTGTEVGHEAVPGRGEKRIATREDYAAKDENIVFYVGRLVREKGVQVLLDAAPQILSHLPNTKFIIAGKGPFENALRKQAESHGLAPRVYFTGYIDDELRNLIYSWSDVAVFPSLYEPFGIVALEGMATKTPVVVSDTGGIGGIVDHGVDGLKAYTGDSHSLAEQIMAILRNPELGRRLSEKAYEKVTKIYNWENIARETIDTYRGVLNDYNANPWVGETKPGNKIFDIVPRIFGRYN